MDCVFCKIINGEIPSNIVYSDDDMVIFPDISPKAPIHYLAVPKVHYPLIADVEGELIGKMLTRISTLANKLGLQKGYRLVINQRGTEGNDAGQEVMHLHIHIMGGRKL